MIMASRNVWCMTRNFLFGSRGWMIQYSAEIFLKSISLRPFSVKCDSKDREPLKNEDLLKNLLTMGVDVDMARRRQPGVFNRMSTNEQALRIFLLSKGASDKVIGSIISRYPRAITRTLEGLSKRWELWRKIMASDLEIVNILERSPESFFRSNNNLNLENNIKFLCSVGLTNKCLYRLLTSAPRTFSNSLNLNKQMVEFLQETSISLGHNDPTDFVRKIICKNPSILIQSTKRVKTNIEFLQSTFNLNKENLLLLLCGPGAGILDLSNDCTKRNYTNIQEKLLSLGCTDEEGGTHYVDQARLELTEIHLSYCFPSAGLKGVSRHTWCSHLIVTKKPKILLEKESLFSTQKLDACMQKNETRYLPLTLFKDQLLLDLNVIPEPETNRGKIC
ncbi:transcription termination factor 1, mitochondrial [Peromyscus californicus insignis]|uniref:transcription termination factor 1, mitochondrial n=1 Tax=Peromyscus californicus insignis TaxID=564181 RepID=UPI0022A7688B|nr:transcription termination factor 1, mitochondrial [Peromyscus californicus insignis]XP_052577328.1 transcription termination factor 1, mitochondrial [Peromyscus californicus insignis]XP_052577329.1 transcription termination factor 1, mitochondrial [Peromyscus californicus insignis]